jgi:hypothetical protein
MYKSQIFETSYTFSKKNYSDDPDVQTVNAKSAIILDYVATDNAKADIFGGFFSKL